MAWAWPWAPSSFHVGIPPPGRRPRAPALLPRRAPTSAAAQPHDGRAGSAAALVLLLPFRLRQDVDRLQALAGPAPVGRRDLPAHELTQLMKDVLQLAPKGLRAGRLRRGRPAVVP